MFDYFINLYLPFRDSPTFLLNCYPFALLSALLPPLLLRTFILFLSFVAFISASPSSVPSILSIRDYEFYRGLQSTLEEPE